MKTNKSKEKKARRYYSLIGNSLCGCAGGMIGFSLGAPFLVIPGILVGVLAGFVVDRTLNPA